VWVLEERGHTPDGVLFYIPEHQLLHTADMTLPIFPTFPDTNGKATREVLGRCHAMASAGAVSLLTEGHFHERIIRGQDEVVAFLGTILTEHDRFQDILREILEDHDGLTVGEVYAFVCQRHDDPVVRHYLALEYPHHPITLQQVIAVSLPQMGYIAQGPRGKKRFFGPASTSYDELKIA
jgi:glyoxylase-like metal-dependent hydrolase (beta-lactamase superfamily II)